jgi:hypothetical protein
VGGALLGFITISKIFPGILIAYLFIQRRWREVLWSCGFMVIYCGLTVLCFGPHPFVEFIQYQLPRLASGEAFSFLKDVWNAATDYGIVGLLLKLKWLGWQGMSVPAALRANKGYALFLMVPVVLSALRNRKNLPAMAAKSDLRVVEVQTWLALLYLGSLQSPFLAEPMALFHCLWLLTLIGAGVHRPRWTFIAAYGLAWPVLSVVQPYPYTWFGLSASLVLLSVIQLGTIATAVWLLVRRVPQTA